MSAEPEVGCLLLHRIARSYGEIHTHLLCRTPWLAKEASSAARLTSAGVSGPPKVFLLRTYFHMNSPIMDAAIASTTLVWLAEVLTEPFAVYDVAFEYW
jgi:hypothetical protein